MTNHAVREAIEQSLSRAETRQAEAVFILRFDEGARRQADFIDLVRPGGCAKPFAGVPVTIKDNFDIRDKPTTAGSRLLAQAPPASRDAQVVERLRNSGFILLGRTNMTEFAFSGLGVNPHYGTPANPALPGEDRIPGGSSSGAAVSVALGIAPVALGTDTGGSVRIPAAWCGLVGFKPTASAVTRRGVLPLSTTLDAVGIISSKAAECAAVFDVIRDTPGEARIDVPARRIRLGLVTNYVRENVDDPVEQAVRSAVELLGGVGIAIESVDIPEFNRIPELSAEATFAACEAFAWHEPFITAGRGSDYDPRVLTRIAAGGEMSAAAYVRLCRARTALVASLAQRVSGLDALIWPTVACGAPTLGELAADDAYHRINNRALRNSLVANFFDMCAISLPCPVRGAPVGLTLAAPAGRDDHLLSIAVVAEEAMKGT